MASSVAAPSRSAFRFDIDTSRSAFRSDIDMSRSAFRPDIVVSCSAFRSDVVVSCSTFRFYILCPAVLLCLILLCPTVLLDVGNTVSVSSLNNFFWASGTRENKYFSGVYDMVESTGNFVNMMF